MSCFYHLYCKDCGELSEFSINHGNRELARTWEHRRELLMLFDAKEVVKATDLIIEIDVSGAHEGPFGPDFFRKHDGHDVAVQDEYGRIETQCHKYVPCPTCGAPLHCGGLVGHPGECVAEARKR